jgi:hypothetical protein
MWGVLWSYFEEEESCWYGISSFEGVLWSCIDEEEEGCS